MGASSNALGIGDTESSPNTLSGLWYVEVVRTVLAIFNKQLTSACCGLT